MIKFEFPADRKDIALAIGQALVAIGQGKALVNSPAPTTAAEVPAGAVEERVATPAPEDVARTVDEEAVAELETGNANSADQSVTQEQKAAAAHAASDGANVDEKGVPFNAEFCSKAAVPFYGSGKKEGQWKKRQGVDEQAYDDWYADALFSDKIEEDEPAATETTSDSNLAANAFGNQHAAADEAAPQDAGQLMKWVSEQQAAGNISQQQVTEAYTALQLPFDAVMNPAYPVAQNCAAIYNHLKGQI